MSKQEIYKEIISNPKNRYLVVSTYIFKNNKPKKFGDYWDYILPYLKNNYDVDILHQYLNSGKSYDFLICDDIEGEIIMVDKVFIRKYKIKKS